MVDRKQCVRFIGGKPPNGARTICDQFKNNEWDKVRLPSLVQKASDMLRKFNLSKLIKKYVSLEDRIDLLPLMNTKSRADNFIVDAQDINLRGIIESSSNQNYNIVA